MIEPSEVKLFLKKLVFHFDPDRLMLAVGREGLDSISFVFRL